MCGLPSSHLGAHYLLTCIDNLNRCYLSLFSLVFRRTSVTRDWLEPSLALQFTQSWYHFILLIWAFSSFYVFSTIDSLYQLKVNKPTRPLLIWGMCHLNISHSPSFSLASSHKHKSCSLRASSLLPGKASAGSRGSAEVARAHGESRSRGSATRQPPSRRHLTPLHWPPVRTAVTLLPCRAFSVQMYANKKYQTLGFWT